MGRRTEFMTAALAAALAATVVAPAVAQSPAAGDTSQMKIALSNNYAANSWRQAMLLSWAKNAAQALADHAVAVADGQTTAKNDVTEQAQQIGNMILQGYNAIVVNAASPDGLNSVIKEACDAGIVVVSFDGLATEPCGYRVAVDFEKMGRDQVAFLTQKLPNGGNLLEITGLAGTSIDAAISKGIHDGVDASNGLFKIVGSVEGDWSGPVAQAAVAGILPSMPDDIVGVVDQGGDGAGAAAAFAAAGRPMPIIIMGNRQDELAWWKEQKDANGYETWSASIAPGVSTLAFWVAQQVLAGKTVPHDLVVPALEVTQDQLDAILPTIEVGSLLSHEYTQAETEQIITDAIAAGAK